MRKIKFIEGEYYHIYNRGVDKRDIFIDQRDHSRFLESIQYFNTVELIGSIKEFRLRKENNQKDPLVSFICFCLNQNHFHFLLTPLVEKGIEKFMHRFGTGYTNYFNQKYKRSGSLFQGRFKAIHVGSNEYLLHLSAYINLNYRIHKIRSSASVSSWKEYIGKKKGEFCNKAVILDQFPTIQEYIEFAESSVETTIQKRQDKVMEDLYIEEIGS